MAGCAEKLRADNSMGKMRRFMCCFFFLFFKHLRYCFRLLRFVRIHGRLKRGRFVSVSKAKLESITNGNTC